MTEPKLDYTQRLTLGVTTMQGKHSGKVLEVNVAHDDDCGVFNGRGCTCVPDILVELDGQPWTIDEEGVPHRA